MAPARLRLGRRSAVLLLAALAGAAPCRAEEPEPTSPPPLDPQLQFTLTPSLWLPRLTGESSLGSGALARIIDLDSELDVRDREETAVGEVVVRRDRWNLHASGFHFSTSGSGTFTSTAAFGGVLLTPGDSFRSEFEITSAALHVAYEVWRPYEDDPTTRLRLAPLVGVRPIDVEQTLEEPGVSFVRTGGTWLGVVAGLKLDLVYQRPEVLPFFDRIELRAFGAAGPALGEDGGALFELRTGMSGFLDDNLGVEFGFRLVHLDVENAGYDLNGGLQGLFFAVRWRF